MNEKSATKLKVIPIIQRALVIIDINKNIEKNHLCIQTEGKLEIVKKIVVAFDSLVNQRQRVGLHDVEAWMGV